MQSKGNMGSWVAGIIAIFLVLICLFYLSFTFVGNHYESKAEQYAQEQAAKKGSDKDTYRLAKSEYLKNIANDKV